MSCAQCTDPDGNCCFPVYGLGPHTHAPGPILGSTRMLTQGAGPGFSPDPDEPGMGTWWCPHCGEGNPATSGALAPREGGA